MTISGDTVCSVIQAFPVLLILAQNANRCIKTPLIYKPPSPTHSPEYYEALDALFHTIYGHGDHDHSDDHGHGCDDHHGYEYHGNYGYGKKSDQKYYYNHKPCHPNKHGTNGHGYGQSGHGSHGYGHTVHKYGHSGHGYGHPVYVYKKMPNKSGHGHDATKVHGPQIHNIKHKYKVVVKGNKGVRRMAASIKMEGVKIGYNLDHHGPCWAQQTCDERAAL